MSQPFFSNYKAGPVWLCLRGMLGRARGTREGERRTPLQEKKMACATQSMIGYGEGTYSLEFMRVSKKGMNLPETDQGLGFVRVTLVLL